MRKSDYVDILSKKTKKEKELFSCGAPMDTEYIHIHYIGPYIFCCRYNRKKKEAYERRRCHNYRGPDARFQNSRENSVHNEGVC